MTNGASQGHGPRRRPDADDGAISPPQGGGRRGSAVLSDGRFLRDVFRRREGGGGVSGHRPHQARRGRRRADPDVRRPGPFGRVLPRAPDQGRPSRCHRRADREPRRSAQGARLQGAGRPRDRPAGHAGNVDRGNPARVRLRQLAGGDRPRRGGMGDRRGGYLDRPVRADACGPGELAAELARLSPAESHRRRCRPGHPHARRKRRLRQRPGERALKARFGLATLDGLGSPSRAELAAAGGLLAYLDATQKGSGILLDAPRRIARSSHMAIDAASRDSLELPVRRRQRRRQPARRDRPLPDRGGPPPAVRGHCRPADRPARDRSAARRSSHGSTRTPSGANASGRR